MRTEIRNWNGSWIWNVGLSLEQGSGMGTTGSGMQSGSGLGPERLVTANVSLTRHTDGNNGNGNLELEHGTGIWNGDYWIWRNIR